jgi:hypothetical protein
MLCLGSRGWMPFRMHSFLWGVTCEFGWVFWGGGARKDGARDL